MRIKLGLCSNTPIIIINGSSGAKRRLCCRALAVTAHIAWKDGVDATIAAWALDWSTQQFLHKLQAQIVCLKNAKEGFGWSGPVTVGQHYGSFAR